MKQTPAWDVAVAALTALHDQLAAAEKKGPTAFEHAFHHPPAGVGVHEIDLGHVIRRVSKEELRMLGYSEKQMVGHAAWEFIVMQEASQRAIEQKLAGKKEFKPFARTFRRADGNAMALLLLDRPISNAAGETVGLRTTMTKLPERAVAGG